MGIHDCLPIKSVAAIKHTHISGKGSEVVCLKKTHTFVFKFIKRTYAWSQESNVGSQSFVVSIWSVSNQHVLQVLITKL